jgi:hypothetical protein
METTIKNRKGKSTLILEMDFNQVLNENFEGVCKAIAGRGKALKELLTLFENNNEVIETVLRVLKKAFFEEDCIETICKELHVSNAAAVFLANLPLQDLVTLNCERLKEQYEEYRRTIDLM